MILLDVHNYNQQDEFYSSEDGTIVMRREKDTLTPNGNKMNSRWVLRKNGEMVDFDQYRHDLAGRHDFDLGWRSK